VRDGRDFCRFAKNLREFGFLAVALQNKSSTLSFIESGSIKPATRLIMRTPDDSHISELVLFCFAKVARYCCFQKICSVKLSSLLTNICT